MCGVPTGLCLHAITPQIQTSVLHKIHKETDFSTQTLIF